MKSFYKFALTAAAAITLASCSSDEAYEFAYLYEDLPFEMEQVQRPQIPEREVDIRVGVTVSRLEGDDGVRRIILPGEYLKADLVLLCCGSSPRTELAREAGLEVDRGIVVNSRMMTAKYGIFACGDCTQIGQTVCGTWREAENMGLFAGRNAAGEDAMYHPLPTTLSADFFGIRLITGENGTGEVQKETDHSML